jgi:hypothetical protein
MFVINERPFGPQFLGDFLSSQKFSGSFQEHEEHLERLGVQFNANPLPSKLSRSGVYFECSKAVAPGWP